MYRISSARWFPIRWLIFSLILLATLPAPTATAQGTPVADETTGWTHFRGDSARRGETNAGPVQQPVELWRHQAEGSCNPVPAVVGDTVYAACDDETLRALDAHTGEVRWQFTAEPFVDGPSISEDLAYVVGASGTLYAVDIATGTERWRYDDTPVELAPAVDGGLAVTPTTDGYLLGLDADSGEERWRYQVTEGGLARLPALLDGIAYAGSETADFTAIDGATGELIWTVDTGEGFNTAAVVADGIAYIGTLTEDGSGTLAAYDAATGELIWQRDERIFTPSVSNGVGYSGSGSGTVYAFDTATGEELWQTQIGGVARPGAVAGNIVYVPSDGDRAIYAFDTATGEELWHIDVDGGIFDQMAVADGRIYVTTTFGVIQAFGEGDSDMATPPPAASPAAPDTEMPATPAVPAEASPVASGDLATFLWDTTEADVDLDGPTGVWVAPDGTIWVGNGALSRFELFTPNGEFIESWGEAGDGDGQFNFAGSDGIVWGRLAFAPDGSFYVADRGNLRIQRFDADRQFLHAWGGFGPGDGEFIAPFDIAVDSQGNVFVNDYERGDVQIFAADGTYLRTFGGYGSEPGQLFYQWFMTIDSNDHIWVADGNNGRVQVWDNDGQFVAAYDAGGTIGYPTAVAIDDQGRMLVCDGDGLKVVVLDSSGAVIGQFGEGQFESPEGIALDGEGNAYVLDYFANRVVKFQLLPPIAP